MSFKLELKKSKNLNESTASDLVSKIKSKFKDAKVKSYVRRHSDIHKSNPNTAIGKSKYVTIEITPGSDNKNSIFQYCNHELKKLIDADPRADYLGETPVREPRRDNTVIISYYDYSDLSDEEIDKYFNESLKESVTFSDYMLDSDSILHSTSELLKDYKTTTPTKFICPKDEYSLVELNAEDGQHILQCTHCQAQYAYEDDDPETIVDLGNINESLKESVSGPKYVTRDIIDKTDSQKLKDAYDEGELEVLINGDTWYTERCPKGLGKELKAEMKRLYPDIKHLYGESVNFELKEDTFDYDENSEKDQLIWDHLSTNFADKCLEIIGVDSEKVPEQEWIELINLLVRICKMTKGFEYKEDLTEGLKLILKEDFNSNFPEWIVNALRNSSRYQQDLKKSLLNKKIDLTNATFIEALPPRSNRDPVLKDPNRLAVFHIRDAGGDMYIYTPDGFCNPYVKVDSNSWESKYVDQLSWKWILDHTMDYGYFDMANPDTTAAQLRSDRADAKKGMVTRGKGQHKYVSKFDGTARWIQTKGEDKSGYKLDPQKYTRMLDDVNLNNYSVRLESYYSKIEEVRSGIIEALQSADLLNKDYLAKGSFSSGVTGDISAAIKDLDQAIYYYKDLCSQIERVIKRADKYTDDRYTVDDAIKDAFRFNSNNVREYLKDAAEIVAHIKSNPVRPAED